MKGQEQEYRPGRLDGGGEENADQARRERLDDVADANDP
jgi:hypothetical protein